MTSPQARKGAAFERLIYTYLADYATVDNNLEAAFAEMVATAKDNTDDGGGS